MFRVGRRRFAIVNGRGSPPRPRWASSGPSLHFLADPDELDAVDWGEIAELLESAYRQVAPRLRPGGRR